MFSRSRQAAIISSMTRRSRADMPAYVNGISTFWNLASRCAMSGATWEGSSDTAASRAMASSFMARDSNTCDQNRPRDDLDIEVVDAFHEVVNLDIEVVNLDTELVNLDIEVVDHDMEVVRPRHRGCRPRHRGCRPRHRGCRPRHRGCRPRHRGC